MAEGEGLRIAELPSCQASKLIQQGRKGGAEENGEGV